MMTKFGIQEQSQLEMYICELSKNICKWSQRREEIPRRDEDLAPGHLMCTCWEDEEDSGKKWDRVAGAAGVPPTESIVLKTKKRKSFQKTFTLWIWSTHEFSRFYLGHISRVWPLIISPNSPVHCKSPQTPSETTAEVFSWSLFFHPGSPNSLFSTQQAAWFFPKVGQNISIIFSMLLIGP